MQYSSTIYKVRSSHIVSYFTRVVTACKNRKWQKNQRCGDFQYVLPACSINKSTFNDFIIIKHLLMSSFSAVLDFFPDKTGLRFITLVVDGLYIEPLWVKNWTAIWAAVAQSRIHVFLKARLSGCSQWGKLEWEKNNSMGLPWKCYNSSSNTQFIGFTGF